MKNLTLSLKSAKKAIPLLFMIHAGKQNVKPNFNGTFLNLLKNIFMLIVPFTTTTAYSNGKSMKKCE